MYTTHSTLHLGGASRRVLAVASLTLSAASAGAQVSPTRGEIRPFVGAYLPTGDQRDLLKDAFLLGAQATYRLIPQFAVTGTFAWSPNEDRIARGTPSVDVYHYDLGIEGRAASWVRRAGWDFTPFAGIGLGGRTYDYDGAGVDSRTRLVGYGALGGELGFGRIGVRVEGRDYLSSNSPPLRRGESETRNDITVSAGLTVRF